MFYEDFGDILDKTFIVTRQTQTLDPNTNRPIKTKTNFGPYKGYIGRKTVTSNDGLGATILNESFRLYTGADVNVKFGDIVTVNNVQYDTGFIYKPLNDHTEIDLKLISEK